MAAASAAESSAGVAEREQLKQKLSELLETTDGNLTDESKALIASLEKLNPTKEPATKPELYTGPFQMLNSSMQGVLYRGAVLTLGRCSFNMFQPAKLKIQMREVYNDVNLASEGAYDLGVEFTIVEDGSPPLRGLLLNRARCSPSGPAKLDIQFLGSVLMPQDSNIDLDAWREIFKVNPEMDDKGFVRKDMPPLKNWLDVTYIDDDLRITHGGQGSIVVVKRLPESKIVYA